MNNSAKPWEMSWSRVGLPALTVLLGVQLLRVMVPLMMSVLRDRFGWSAIEVGLLAFAVFLMGFLAGGLNRFFRTDFSLALTAVAVGVSRLALQFWTGDPLGDLVIALVGTAVFVLFLGVYIAWARSHGAPGTSAFGLGILVGLMLELALHGLFGTYDMSWRPGWGTATLTIALVLLQMVALTDILRREVRFTTADAPLWPALSWAAFGPFLFLQLLVFINIAWLNTATGWNTPAPFAILLTAHLLGIAATLLPRYRARLLALFALVIALALSIVIFPLHNSNVLVAVSFAVVGQVSLSLLLMAILSGLGDAPARAGMARLSVTHGVGMLLMAVMLFVYYASYDLRLPFSNTLLPVLALALVGLAAAAILGRGARRIAVAREVRPLLPALSLLLLIPVVQWIFTAPARPMSSSNGPLRVMTYNLHFGFDPLGDLSLEQVARTIEAQNPDVVGLQEVSRGWVLNGSTDMLAWLSQRLGMPYVFGPATDAQWGNAVLSRHPVLQSHVVSLPPDDLLLKRSFIWAELDTGGEPFNFVSVHYHHPDDGSPIRVTQSTALLDYWRERPYTVIVGDFNATPEAPEIVMLRDAGLVDIFEAAGTTERRTYSALEPRHQIDYIWTTPDLRTLDAAVLPDTGSDHLAISGTVARE